MLDNVQSRCSFWTGKTNQTRRKQVATWTSPKKLVSMTWILHGVALVDQGSIALTVKRKLEVIEL